jgi:hypothetical protein
MVEAVAAAGGVEDCAIEVVLLDGAAMVSCHRGTLVQCQRWLFGLIRMTKVLISVISCGLCHQKRHLTPSEATQPEKDCLIEELP